MMSNRVTRLNKWVLLTVAAVLVALGASLSHCDGGTPPKNAQSQATPPSRTTAQALQQLKALPQLQGATWTPFTPQLYGDKKITAIFDILVNRGEISEDGTQLLVFAVPLADPRLDAPWILDLQSGKLNMAFLSYKDPDPLARYTPLLDGHWEPHSSQHLYFSVRERDNTHSIQRISLDGKHATTMLNNADGVMFPPDGKQIYYWKGTPGGEKFVTAPFDTPEKCYHVMWPERYTYFSPDMRVLADPYSQGVYLYNIGPRLEVQQFSVTQINWGTIDGHGINGAIAYWLPDSSALLVSVTSEREEFEASQVWLVQVNGEVRKVADNVYVLGNSLNGKHWLFYLDGEYYRASVR